MVVKQGRTFGTRNRLNRALETSMSVEDMHLTCLEIRKEGPTLH